MLQRPLGVTRIEIIAQHQHQIGTNGRRIAKIAVTVFVPRNVWDAGGTGKIDDCKIRFTEFHSGSQMFGHFIRAVGADTSPRALEQLSGKTDGLIIGRGIDGKPLGTQRNFVSRDPLLGNAHVDIRCGKDKIMNLEFSPRVETRGACLEGQFPQGGNGDVCSAAMGDHVDPLHFRKAGDETQHLTQMIDSKLARFTIVGIAEQSRITRRPSIDNRHTDAADKMPKLGKCKGGIFESVVLALDINENVLAGGQRKLLHQHFSKR